LEPLREFIDSATSASIYRGETPAQDEMPSLTHIDFAGHTAYVRSFSFNKDASLMVTASDDGTARVWNTTTGQTVGKLEGHTDAVNSATFSGDGKFIVTASNDKTVKIWDAASFALVRNVGDSFAEPVHSAEYNANGDLIVVASGNAASIYDAHTGQLKRRFEEDTEVNTASFSPDSRLVITATNGKLAHVWDAQTGESVATLADHKGAVFQAFFSADGQRVFTASEYEVRSYPREAFAPFQEIRSLIDQRVRRTLTEQERKAYLSKPE
jgi:WD40 repeat protein